MVYTVENYPAINIPSLYKYGLAIQNSTVSTNTNLSVLAGICRDSQNITDIRFGDNYPDANGNVTSAPVRIDNTKVGAGGLDESPVYPDTMYAIYIIADSSGYLPVSAIATAGINIFRVPAGPTMPAGYDSQRLIGFWATDSSSYWYKGYYFGVGNDLLFMYDEPQITSVTAGSSNVYDYVNLLKFVPDIENTPAYISTIFTPGLAGNTLTLASGKSSSVNGQEVITGQVAGIPVTTTSLVYAQHVLLSPFPLVSPAIQYKVSGTDTVAIYVKGFGVSI